MIVSRVKPLMQTKKGRPQGTPFDFFRTLELSQLDHFDRASKPVLKTGACIAHVARPV